MGSTTQQREMLAVSYEKWAQAYLHSLPLEHFMESVGQSTQRKITMESLDLLQTRRPDVHVFGELLVQYPRPRQRRPGQVVPDNIVVISTEPIAANTSYNMPLEPAGPYWVLEYVSQSNKRKDYRDNMMKYERDLKVPYYSIFHPEDQELAVYRHDGKKYAPVKPNRQGRYAIAKLDIEIRILEGWMRFWLKGELLPLPAELAHDLELARHEAREAKKRAGELERRLEDAERELAQLRASMQAPTGRRANGARPPK